ncbi:MAG: type II toxin-antitoxin system RelE/ParE family toxin [Prochlorotrichaceae cyanobacterium]
MIQSFKNKGTQDIFNGIDSKAARKTCPQSLWKVARRKLIQVNVSGNLDDLNVPPGNKLKALTGDREGQHSVRINDQFRVCFIWYPSGVSDVELTDYH